MMHAHHHLDLLLRWDRGLVLQQAIRDAVQPGMRVLDAGTGSGLLALWAARAGASEVIGVDLAPVEVARTLARANGLEDRVRFVSADFRALDPEVVPGRFDVVTGMLYYNDPRRDEAQSRLTTLIHDSVLAPGGQRIPDAVEYTAFVCDWPAQDLESRVRSIRGELLSLESRYGLKLESLVEDCLSHPSPSWFPTRAGNGRLESAGARLLSDETEFVRIDYDRGFEGYPGEFEIGIASPGIATGVIWVQTLWYREHLIFRNESMSWLGSARSVVAGDQLRLAIDDGWRRTNVLRELGDLHS